MKYEYMIFDVWNSTPEGSNFIEELNRLGSSGWRVVCKVSTTEFLLERGIVTGANLIPYTEASK